MSRRIARMRRMGSGCRRFQRPWAGLIASTAARGLRTPRGDSLRACGATALCVTALLLAGGASAAGAATISQPHDVARALLYQSDKTADGVIAQEDANSSRLAAKLLKVADTGRKDRKVTVRELAVYAASAAGPNKRFAAGELHRLFARLGATQPAHAAPVQVGSLRKPADVARALMYQGDKNYNGTISGSDARVSPVAAKLLQLADTTSGPNHRSDHQVTLKELQVYVQRAAGPDHRFSANELAVLFGTLGAKLPTAASPQYPPHQGVPVIPPPSKDAFISFDNATQSIMLQLDRDGNDILERPGTDGMGYQTGDFPQTAHFLDSVGRAQMTRAEVRAWLVTFDANGDGQLSLAEQCAAQAAGGAPC